MGQKKKIFKIGNIEINSERTFVVAEISANHCGKLSLLKKIILKLKKINVDAIKIQAYEANTITINSNNKDFQIKSNNTWSKYNTLYNLYKTAETPFKWYSEIFRFCKKNNIIVFASVFDSKSLDLLEKLNCPAYKIASPEITDIPLIEKVSKTKKPIIISTGLSDFKDLKLAISAIKKQKNNKIIVLKCTSAYPAPIEEINLKTMIDIRKKFDVLTGYSDHTEENYTAIHASSMGACMIERHVKLENFKSVDSFFSSTINNFKEMIKIIRINEKSNGVISYKISKSSKPNLNGRKSLYVVKNIKKGEIFSETNIRSIRPSFGLHPKFLKFFLKKKSSKNIRFGTRLEWSHIKKI